jgi:hypothetical protein
MSQVAPYGGPVADFLVELFVPRAGAAVDPRDLVERAAAELAAVGTAVRVTQAIFVPDDETCFLLCKAKTAEAARAAVDRAGLRPARVTEVVVAR